MKSLVAYFGKKRNHPCDIATLGSHLDSLLPSPVASFELSKVAHYTRKIITKSKAWTSRVSRPGWLGLQALDLD